MEKVLVFSIDVLQAAPLSKNSMQQTHGYLILVGLCIEDYSVEIPTRCSFVIEFIIPKFFKGSKCFERHTAHHQEL